MPSKEDLVGNKPIHFLPDDIGDHVRCGPPVKYARYSRDIEKVTCGRCKLYHQGDLIYGAEQARKKELEELKRRASERRLQERRDAILLAQEGPEIEGYCPECEQEKPSRLIQKRWMNRAWVVMCIECWKKVFTASVGNKFGSRAEGTSTSHSLYCPTCMQGWNKECTKTLVPRECFRCRTGLSSPEAELPIQHAKSHAECMHEYIPEFRRPEVLTDRIYEPTNIEGRGLELVNPGRDLCTDLEMVRNMFFIKRGIGRLFDRDAPRVAKKKYK